MKNQERRCVVIWVDGTLGVGKTSVANELVKFFRDMGRDYDHFDSDHFWNIYLKSVMDTHMINKTFPTIGMMPQYDPVFLDVFRKGIETKVREAGLLIASMALTTMLCKEVLIDPLIEDGFLIKHFILVADTTTIRQRILGDIGRGDKDTALNSISSQLILKDLFPEAVIINSDGIVPLAIAKQIMKYVQ